MIFEKGGGEMIFEKEGREMFFGKGEGLNDF